MTEQDFELVARVFERARSLGETARGDLVEREFADRPDLRDELCALLDADGAPDTAVLDGPMLGSGFNVRRWLDGLGAQRPEQPERIGPYQVRSVLSEGAHTAVYLAAQARPLERLVAVKVLLSRAARRDVLRRFEAERATLALMQHPNIASIYDAGETEDGHAYFAMEHVPGQPITSFCERMGLPIVARLALFAQACRAVEHAHQRGVIHRDLKPSNILAMRRPDGTDAVKVIDFGIAKAVQGARAGNATAMVTTEQGTLLGTIPYMAPEQLWRDPAAVDTRADVYALGAVLYEVLSGRTAYQLEGLGPAAAIETVTHTRPPRLGQVRRGLKGDLEVIVEKAMRAAPEERYDGVSGLRADLSRFSAHRPIAARPQSVLYLAGKFVARHRAVVAAGAALVLVAGAAYVELVREERLRYREACDTAFAWLQETARMTRTVGQHGLRGPLLARLDRESNRFLQATPGDPAVVQLRAEVLDALGDERLEDGDLEGARAAFNEAVDLHGRLAPGSPHQSAALSRAIVRRGDAAKASGDPATMRVCYEQALAMDKHLAGARPDDPEALTNLIWSHDRVGVDDGLRGDAARSLEHHTAQLRLAERLAKPPDERLAGLVATADARRAVSTAHGHLGAYAAARGDTAGWREHAAAALRWAQDAAAASPSDRLAIKEVLGARMSLSRAEEAATGRPRDLAEAEAVERDAAAVRASDPGDSDLCFMHVLAMLNTAAVASAHGRDDLAERRLIEAEAVADDLRSANPRDASRAWLHATAAQELDKTRERMSRALLEGSDPYP